MFHGTYIYDSQPSSASYEASTNLPPMQNFLKPVNSASLETEHQGLWSLGSSILSTTGLVFDTSNSVLQNSPSSLDDQFSENWDFPNEDYLLGSSPELEGKQKIDRACVEMNISKDPQSWRMEQVLQWIRFFLRHYNFSPALINEQDWMVNGEGLCQMTVSDFNTRLPHAGELLHAELELWKTECMMTSIQGALLEDLGSNEVMDSGKISYATLESCHNPMVNGLVSSNQSVSPLPSEQIFVNPILVQQADPNLQMTTYGVGETIGTQYDRKASPPMLWGGQRVKSEMMDDNLSDEGGYQLMRINGVLSTSNYYLDENKIKQNSRKYQVNRMATENAGGSGGGNRMPDGILTPWGHRRGKRTICLWQFLMELLLHPENNQSIRWLDRGKGIFKIEDSVRVAKMWGERKNRPAMNYDKLSRSIRQYYKKGIITKTENSKRLVYQFCKKVY